MGWFSKNTGWKQDEDYKPEITEEINSRELRKRLKKFVSWKKISLSDGVYRIPADPAAVLKHFYPRRFKYKKDEKDCDDAVRIVRGRLSDSGCGNLLVINCKIKQVGAKYPHRCVAFLHKGKLIFGSCQLGKIVDYDIERIIWMRA